MIGKGLSFRMGKRHQGSDSSVVFFPLACPCRRPASPRSWLPPSALLWTTARRNKSLEGLQVQLPPPRLPSLCPPSPPFQPCALINETPSRGPRSAPDFLTSLCAPSSVRAGERQQAQDLQVQPRCVPQARQQAQGALTPPFLFLSFPPHSPLGLPPMPPFPCWEAPLPRSPAAAAAAAP